MDNERIDTNLGISRRTLLKRGAVVGGTLVWAAPAVQSFARPALAQTAGSPACTFDVILKSGGTCRKVGECTAPQECCDCLDSNSSNCENECAAQQCKSTPPQTVPCP